MNALLARVRNHDESDAGLTLVELLVALMIFAIVAVGTAFSLVSILSMTKDGTAREVAANLAAQDIDKARASGDVTTLGNSSQFYTINGIVYHLTRTTGWVLSGSSTGGCGTGGGTLQYKQANVTVTWTGMNPVTPAVRADTLIAPAGRINDPTLGTLIVSVLGASGTGKAGVTVTATPSAVAGNTAMPLTVVPSPTDANGCSYILKVTPGTYDVTISATNFVSDKQEQGSVIRQTGVAAGTSASVGFQFDLAAYFSVSYATNYTASTPQFPTNLDTTFYNTFGTWYTTAPATNPAPFHPYPAGYSIFAGKFLAPSGGGSTSCLSVDPAAWTTPASSDGAIGQREPAVSAAPGATASVGVNMGIIGLSGVSSNPYITAVSQSTAPGTDDPGCLQTMTYTFPRTNGSVLALPYGSWKLYRSDSFGVLGTQLTALQLSPQTRGQVDPVTGIVTLDPRVVVVP